VKPETILEFNTIEVNDEYTLGTFRIIGNEWSCVAVFPTESKRSKTLEKGLYSWELRKAARYQLTPHVKLGKNEKPAQIKGENVLQANNIILGQAVSKEGKFPITNNRIAFNEFMFFLGDVKEGLLHIR
jgi:hypothetical protein